VEKEKSELLSEREKQIAKLAAQGLTDKEIARKSGVSITTVRTYWMRIRRKVQATNRAQAIVKGLAQIEAASRSTAHLASTPCDSDNLGVIAIGADGELLAANNSFLNMLGHDRSSFEDEGLTWEELVIEDPIARDTDAHSVDLPPQEGILRHKDGHAVPVMATGTSMDSPHGIDVSCVVDLSDSKSESASHS